MNQQTGQFRALGSPGFICLLLALAVLAVYFPVRNYGFVDYDDSGYFFGNPHVLAGLNWPNVQWAFTSGQDANWHPLTWLSLMLDATLFGPGAAAPHLTNVMLHAANSILVFLLFLRLTGALWRSAALGMLFAIHPLHVESVAWISERKDVLSAFFGLLALICYVRYAEIYRLRTKERRSTPDRSREWLFYGLSLFLFACGLMAKPMLVTLPCVLLLLDFWPLERFKSSGLWRISLEKIPFFALTAATSAVTCLVQGKGGAVIPLNIIPMNARIGNAFVAYARYLGKIFCPIRLAAIYPYPGYWPGLVVFLCIALFAGLCLAAFALRNRFPWLLTGWFWFAGMLVPVIGLVQVGEQAMADRYAYLPMIGVLAIGVWGAAEICLKYRAPLNGLLAFSVILLGACAWLARGQVLFWKDDLALFGHTLAVTKNNYIAELDMGYACSKAGNLKKALAYYAEACHTVPNDPTALFDVGNAFAKLGAWPEAIHYYRRVQEMQPHQPDVMNNLGFALAQSGQLSEAVPCFEAALKQWPDYAEAHNNLGSVYFIQGNFVEAAKQFYDALDLSPDDPRFAVNLGDCLVRLGKKSAAAECYQQALRWEPGNQSVRAKLESLGPQTSK